MKRSVKVAGAVALVFLLLTTVPEKKSYGSDGKAPDLTVPIPVNHGAKGIKLPYYDEKGKLQMDFSIDSAYRSDEGHLEMKQVKMHTYDENGNVEMMIDLPSSILDLTTRIVTSNQPVTIRRSDFEVTGETMQFDTQSKSGKIVGKVRMLIYNLSDMTGKSAQ